MVRNSARIWGGNHPSFRVVRRYGSRYFVNRPKKNPSLIRPTFIYPLKRSWMLPVLRPFGHSIRFTIWPHCLLGYHSAFLDMLNQSPPSSYIWIPNFFFRLFRAIPMAYGGSQARGQIRAVAADLHHSHSNARFEPHLRPIPQLMATPDP